MKKVFIFLMPFLIVTAFMTSNRFFALADYYASALLTLACLCSVCVWIAVISPAKPALH